MYSRSYYADEVSKLTPPDNYDGTAFMEHDPKAIDENLTVVESVEEKTVEISQHSNGNAFGFGKIPFLSDLFGSGNGLGISKPINLGIEEILILATAAFLFFSKDGDKESAIILLLLLFIN